MKRALPPRRGHSPRLSLAPGLHPDVSVGRWTVFYSTSGVGVPEEPSNLLDVTVSPTE